MKDSIKQSKLIKSLMVLFLLFIFTNALATVQEKTPDNKEVVEKKKSDSIQKLKQKQELEKEIIDIIEKREKEAAKNECPLKPACSETITTVSILFFVVMLVLIILFFIQAYKKNMFLGFQSIKFVGLVIMFPGICIVALMGGNLLPGSTLAALLGTIAGYVLSREDDSTRQDTLRTERDALNVDKENLNKEIDTLKEEIKLLKK